MISRVVLGVILLGFISCFEAQAQVQTTKVSSLSGNYEFISLSLYDRDKTLSVYTTLTGNLELRSDQTLKGEIIFENRVLTLLLAQQQTITKELEGIYGADDAHFHIGMGHGAVALNYSFREEQGVKYLELVFDPSVYGPEINKSGTDPSVKEFIDNFEIKIVLRKK